jgi:site-specific DNA-methyltransferase (adenine-specific)
MVLASTRPGDWCLDPFAGSGTLGAVARATGRRFVLIDESPAATAIATRRIEGAGPAGPRGLGGVVE